MLMWCCDTGPLSKCMPVMAGHVFAHGGRSANQGEPAYKMALTYQIHLQQSAFSEITYYNSDKILTYGPGNIFNRPNRTVYWHSLGKQFYLALILIKVTRVEAIFYNFFVDFTEKSKKMTRLRLWTLKSSHPIMAINDKKWVSENTHFLFAYSGINKMKAFKKLLLWKNDRLSLWEFFLEFF